MTNDKRKPETCKDRLPPCSRAWRLGLLQSAVKTGVSHSSEQISSPLSTPQARQRPEPQKTQRAKAESPNQSRCNASHWLSDSRSEVGQTRRRRGNQRAAATAGARQEPARTLRR